MIQPQPTDKLDYAKAYFDSEYGKIESGWERKNGKTTLHVRIPANTTATVALKNVQMNNITEGGKSATDKSSLQNLRTEGLLVKFDIGSGDYTFEY